MDEIKQGQIELKALTMVVRRALEEIAPSQEADRAMFFKAIRDKAMQDADVLGSDTAEVVAAKKIIMLALP